VHLLILGASARAAAFSARRAGLQPLAADLFADRDLRQIAPARRVAVEGYPASLATAAATFPAAPWIYTGSLENHPALVARIASERPLWGNNAASLVAVRDPVVLSAALRRAGLFGPAVRSDAKGLPRDGSWLVKPVSSAGGKGIIPLTSGDAGVVEFPSYYQQRIAGVSLAAVFIASRGRGGAELIGVTRQWIGRRGYPFAYAGSLGPWPLTPGVRMRIAQVGRAVASAFGLIGLFGVDLILREGVPWPVEVNPRYTASVEVLELALGRPLLAEHARACDPHAAVVPAVAPAAPRPRVAGKLVVFAPARCGFPRVNERYLTLYEPFATPVAGDIPDLGATFAPGDPVLTLIVDGSTVAACRARLQGRRSRWLKRLMRSTSS
jgi:predicted ATP-grasp superfamily ATP-dependent carboligase